MMKIAYIQAPDHKRCDCKKSFLQSQTSDVSKNKELSGLLISEIFISRLFAGAS